jgi:osmotically-inducible protein OsmY
MRLGLLIILIALGLQGCVATTSGAAAGTTGATGTTAVYDKRNVKTILQDENISYQMTKRLFNYPNVTKQSHVVISTYQDTVLLAGQAPTEKLRDKIVEITKQDPRIKRLYDEITIEGPSSSLTRASDAWITAKVKTQLLATKNLKSRQFKVVTENGVVFLMGVVDRSQAQVAVNVARHVDGVQKVVKVFQYDRQNIASNDAYASSDVGTV